MKLPNGATISIDGRRAAIECPIAPTERYVWAAAAVGVLLGLPFLGRYLEEAFWVFAGLGLAGYAAWRANRAGYRTVIDEFRGRVTVTTTSLLAPQTETFGYDDITALGIGEHGTGYAAEVHLRNGRRVRLMWSHKDYIALERAMEPLWRASLIAKADPAAPLRLVEKEAASAGTAASTADAAKPVVATGEREPPPEPFGLAPGSSSFRVVGQTAYLESPPGEKGCAVVVLVVVAVVALSIISTIVGEQASVAQRIAVILVVLAVVAGIWFWLEGQFALKVAEFDAGAQEVRLIKRRLWQSSVDHHPFSTIVSIGITEHENDDDRVFGIAMTMRDGRAIKLATNNDTYLHWHAIMIRLQETTGLERRDSLVGERPSGA